MSDATHHQALDLLARREHSRRELARKLRRRGHSRDEIGAELERLEAAGLVSDERFARLFVADRLAVRPQGRRRLLLGLRARGIASEVAAAAVRQVYEERGVCDHELARELARRRARGLAALDPAAARRRLTGFLARRGFDAEVVAEAVRAALSPAVSEDAREERDGER